MSPEAVSGAPTPPIEIAGGAAGARARLANPVVEEEVFESMRFWASKGVDGFRVDAARHLFESDDGQLADQPETHAFMQRMRERLHAEYPDVLLLAEAWIDVETLRDYWGDGYEYQLAFSFDVAASIKQSISSGQRTALESVLKRSAAAYPDRLEVMNADALDVDARAHLTPPIRVVANLPYNVGTELLVRWLTPPDWPPYWQSLTLMFQKEVAERIVALPGQKAYGRLALLAQWRTDARIVMTLPPEAFTPAPKVRSAVVHLTALPAPRFPADPATLNRIVAAGFNQRRKMLRSSLKGIAPGIEARLEAVGIAPTARAEEIGLEAYCRLARALDGG